MSFADFDAHAQAVALLLAAQMQRLINAVDDLGPALGREALALHDLTSEELAWFRRAEEAGRISETSCYFEYAAAHSLGVFHFNLAATEALHFVETSKSSYATSVADHASQGDDAFDRAARERNVAAAQCR